MEDLTDQELGPYRVVAALGAGGMARVYQAFQPAVNRYVALKVLPREFSADRQFLERFQREANLVARLQHPHIVPVFDFGESNGYTFLVMPLIRGGTLASLVQPPLTETARVIQQVADALDYAHANGVTHRDLKPTNILIDEGGNCLLADFGIARMAEGATALTQTGSLIGTPAYMSPEQAKGEAVGPASDIYSLGIVLYELLTGRVPFQAETPVAVALQHIGAPLPRPRRFNPALTPALEAVVLKALARRPTDRFASAGALARALSAAVQASDQPSLSEPVGPPVPALLLATDATKYSRRWWMPTAAIGLLALLLYWSFTVPQRQTALSSAASSALTSSPPPTGGSVPRTQSNLSDRPPTSDNGTSPRGTTRSLGSDIRKPAAPLAEGIRQQYAPPLQFEVVYRFKGAPDGSNPLGQLLLATDGNLYGTTAKGGAHNFGTIFRLHPDGTLRILHSFNGDDGGAYPATSLVQATDGNLYGTASDLVFRVSLDGILTPLHRMVRIEGLQPNELIQASDGNFYGTSRSGGVFGFGTVFRITPTGTVRVIHSFAEGQPGSPTSWTALLQARDGDLYGTTTTDGPKSYGTLFKTTLAGAYKVLHYFDGSPDDGANPLRASLIQGTDGNLYGVTQTGGRGGQGTLFRLGADGAYRVLFNFFSPIGFSPGSRLLEGRDRFLYGTSSNVGRKSGTVFRVSLDGEVSSLVYDFKGGANGYLPWSGLVTAADGSLYGTTQFGGTLTDAPAPDGDGVVYRLSPLRGRSSERATGSEGASR